MADEKKVEKQAKETSLDKEAKALVDTVTKYVDNAIEGYRKEQHDARKKSVVGVKETNKMVKKLEGKEKTAHFIRSVALGDRSAIAEITGSSEKVQPLQEGTAARGGYLVPEEWSSEIVGRMNESAVIRPNAKVVRVSRDTFHIPNIASGAKAFWRSESAEKNTTTVDFGENVLTPYSLASIIVASEELLADEDYNLVDILTDQFAEALVYEEESAFINGDGSGKPTGIDNYTASYQVDAGGALSGDHLQQLYHRATAGHRSKYKWLAHPLSLQEVRTLKDSQNRYLFEFNNNSAGSPVQRLLGLDILESSHVDQDKIFLVNLNDYWIGDRQQMTLDVSREATVKGRELFTRNEVAFRAEERVDGELVNTQSLLEIVNVRTGG